MRRNCKGNIKLIEDMHIAGAQFDLDAGENMRSVKGKVIQTNEA